MNNLSFSHSQKTKMPQKKQQQHSLLRQQREFESIEDLGSATLRECVHGDFSKVRVCGPLSPRIQRMEACGNAGDRFEEEADRVATDVVSIVNQPVPERARVSLQLLPSVQRFPAEEEGAAPTQVTTPKTGRSAEAAPAGLIVEDEAAELRHEQVRKTEFLDALQAAVCKAADAE
ncbi:MAG: hypothetical protein V2I32_15905, partial [Desulforhopalus sp.]|nr:hypothetical protein [Desulforhopalus sp.]